MPAVVQVHAPVRGRWRCGCTTSAGSAGCGSTPTRSDPMRARSGGRSSVSASGTAVRRSRSATCWPTRRSGKNGDVVAITRACGPTGTCTCRRSRRYGEGSTAPSTVDVEVDAERAGGPGADAVTTPLELENLGEASGRRTRWRCRRPARAGRRSPRPSRGSPRRGWSRGRPRSPAGGLLARVPPERSLRPKAMVSHRANQPLDGVPRVHPDWVFGCGADRQAVCSCGTSRRGTPPSPSR